MERANRARLEELYLTDIRPALQKKLGVTNIMQVPKVDKIVINVGAGKDAVSDSKVLTLITDVLGRISGQKAVKTLARKSIAGFKLREGMPIGAKVTLRGRKMYEFLDRLITAALPTVRDLQGVSPKFDGKGDYTLGIKDWTIFPEIEYDLSNKVYGLSVAISTTAANDEGGFELLKAFGMPFKKKIGK